MDDRNRRKWGVATDRLGPGTGVRPRLSRRGIGGVLFVRGNPVSFTVDPVLGCLPWITLSGGRDARSQAVRDALNAQDAAQQEGTAAAGGFPDLASFLVGGTPVSGGSGTTSGNTGSPQGAPSPTPPPASSTNGAFAYIKAARPNGGH